MTYSVIRDVTGMEMEMRGWIVWVLDGEVVVRGLRSDGS